MRQYVAEVLPVCGEHSSHYLATKYTAKQIKSSIKAAKKHIDTDGTITPLGKLT